MTITPDTQADITIQELGQLITAGKNLEAELIKLHRHHHGSSCPACQALTAWWTLTGR